MFRLITNNFSIKLGCLLTAIFLWVYVAAGQSTVGKFPSSIKIKAINNPSGVVAIYDTKTVNVKIMAEPTVWRKLSADSFSAYVDLSSATAGTYELPVTVVSSVPGVQIVERTPEKILITLEPIVSKEVTVNKKIEGSAGEGLVAGSVEVEPQKVEGRGAKSLIENLNEATVVINLNGETEEFKKTAPVVAFDEEGEIVSGIEFKPSEVSATVPIVKGSNNKTVGVRVVTSGSPKTGYYVSGVTVSPSVVDVTGSRALIADLNYIETADFDISGAALDIEREVSLDIPMGLALQSGVSGRVKVKVTIGKNETTKEVSPLIQYKNLDSNYRVTNLQPSQVKVVCSGSAEQMGALQSNSISLQIDLRGKSSGIYTFEISPDDFAVPEGVTINSVLPSAISVTIESK